MIMENNLENIHNGPIVTIDTIDTIDPIAISDITNGNSDTITLDLDPDHIYKTLIDELYETINDNYDLFDTSGAKISKPDIHFDITKKTVWRNFGNNCEQINRTVKQVQKFIDSEFGIESSINKESQLLIKGRYSFNMLSASFKKYIKNYVQCTSCKSIRTEIVRNSNMRLDYLECLNAKCKTSKAIIKIK